MASPTRNREWKIARAHTLREIEHWTLREIGEELGHEAHVIWQWLNPEKVKAENKKRNGKKREWESGECPQCGGYWAGAKRSDTEMCRPCRDDEYERNFKTEALRYIKRREEGLLNSEIEELEGLPFNRVAKCLMEAKKRYGMDVPRSPYFKAPA